jgi:hypothetical protein
MLAGEDRAASIRISSARHQTLRRSISLPASSRVCSAHWHRKGFRPLCAQAAELRPDRTLGYQIEIWFSILARKAFAAATSPPTRCTKSEKSLAPSTQPWQSACVGPRPQNPCGPADESYHSAQTDEAECRVYCQTLRRSLKACRCPAELRQPPPATAMRALFISRAAQCGEGGPHRWSASRQGISLFFVPGNA